MTAEPAQSPSPGQEAITLGGGCFWCLEAVYEELQGVTGVASGYSGGATPTPSYYQVCSGKTGHAEVVQVTFDPQVISSREVLEVFFSIHDPTTLNRQGADVGTQYRSAIFYHSTAQQLIAQQLIAELNAAQIWKQPIVTEVTPFETFYKAEEEHQEFFRRNPYQPYCRVVIEPKMAKFRQYFSEKRKKVMPAH